MEIIWPWNVIRNILKNATHILSTYLKEWKNPVLNNIQNSHENKAKSIGLGFESKLWALPAEWFEGNFFFFKLD